MRRVIHESGIVVIHRDAVGVAPVRRIGLAFIRNRRTCIQLPVLNHKIKRYSQAFGNIHREKTAVYAAYDSALIYRIRVLRHSEQGLKSRNAPV